MTPEDPWTQQFEAFGRFLTGQRELAKRQLRQLAARYAQQQAAVQAWSEAVEKIVPAAVPAPQTAGLPVPRDVVRDGFDFAEQLLAAQSDFTARVLAAVRPVTEKRS